MKQLDADEALYHLVLKLDPEEIDDNDEPSRFVFRAAGSIQLWRNGEDGDETAEDIGRFACLSVDVSGAISEEESVLEVFDSSGETWSYCEALYDEDGEWNAAVQSAAFGRDEPWYPNLFVIDTVLIKAEYRGNGYGLAAVRLILRRFRPGVTGLAVIEPIPAQDWRRFMTDVPAEERFSYRLDEFKESGMRATAKLARHFAKLGFKSVAKTPYMVMHTERKLPSVEDLIVNRVGTKRDLSHLPPPPCAEVFRLRPRDSR